MSTDSERRAPVVSLATGGLSVALWENAVAGEDGAERTMKSVSIRRSYFNRKDNQFAEQKMSINPYEVACLVGLLQEMQRALIDRRGNHVEAVTEF